MTTNLQYLNYVIRHKIFVFIAGRKTGVPLWRLIIHDWSKFTPAEWSGYRNRFFSGNAGKLDKESDPEEFHQAWTHHWHLNPHHWEYWLKAVKTPDHIRLSLGWAGFQPMEMPNTYVLEMVADWMGAGRAITGSWDITEWFEENKGRMTLHPKTRLLAEKLVYKYGKGK